jgi:hypothetical protein
VNCQVKVFAKTLPAIMTITCRRPSAFSHSSDSGCVSPLDNLGPGERCYILFGSGSAELGETNGQHGSKLGTGCPGKGILHLREPRDAPKVGQTTIGDLHLSGTPATIACKMMRPCKMRKKYWRAVPTRTSQLVDQGRGGRMTDRYDAVPSAQAAKFRSWTRGGASRTINQE